MARMSPLRRRMIEDMTVRNLSPATQRFYLHAVAKFSRYFNRSPDRLGLEEVRAFQVHLVSTGISWGALNQTVCALRFFFGVTLDHDESPERIPYARRTTQAAGGLERRRGGAVPGGGAEPEDPHRVDHDLFGGHTERCRDCGHTRIAYNSCRNRHCPKCRGPARAAWLAELLPAAPHEFIRRFLLHSLPDGFQRIRYYGFLANGHRTAKLDLCRAPPDWNTAS